MNLITRRGRHVQQELSEVKTIMCARYRGDTAKEAEALKFRLIDKQRNGIMLSSERDVDMGHSHPYGKVRFWHTNRDACDLDGHQRDYPCIACVVTFSPYYMLSAAKKVPCHRSDAIRLGISHTSCSLRSVPMSYKVWANLLTFTTNVEE